MFKERFCVLLSVILGKSSRKDVHANALKTKYLGILESPINLFTCFGK